MRSTRNCNRMLNLKILIQTKMKVNTLRSNLTCNKLTNLKGSTSSKDIVRLKHLIYKCIDIESVSDSETRKRSTNIAE